MTGDVDEHTDTDIRKHFMRLRLPAQPYPAFILEKLRHMVPGVANGSRMRGDNIAPGVSQCPPLDLTPPTSATSCCY